LVDGGRSQRLAARTRNPIGKGSGKMALYRFGGFLGAKGLARLEEGSS